jgi:hypothetical protein
MLERRVSRKAAEAVLFVSVLGCPIKLSTASLGNRSDAPSKQGLLICSIIVQLVVDIRFLRVLNHIVRDLLC